MAPPSSPIDPPLYNDFLAEMRALDEFRAQLSTRHPEAQVRRDDPDVRRLMEAMAYFSVRSRRQLLHNMEATWLRLFADQFEPLITVLPAVAMVQAVVHPRRTEVTVLPRGAELRLTNSAGAVASFRTLADLRILPVRLEQARLLRGPAGQYHRIALELVSRFAHRDPVGLLRLHTRIVDDYPASARLLYNLRAHLQRAHVVYDAPLDAEQVGEPCETSYGSDHPPLTGRGNGGPGGGPETTHPLERVRAFFHFPERELFLNVAVPPTKGNRPWQRLVIYLDLEPDWPQEDIAPDLFYLHTVPAENLHREPAMPLSCDGTKDALAIRHPHPEQGYVLRSVLGVYLIDDTGLHPLRSGTLPDPPALADLASSPPGDALSYQIEERLTPIGPRPYVLVRAPTALVKPLRLHVDGLWYQPGFAQHPVSTVGPSRPTLVNRVLEGLDWQLLGGVRAEGHSPLRSEVQGLLRVLSMSMRPMLSEPELRWLMQLLVGGSGPAAYRSLPGRLQKFTWSVSPDSALRGSGLRHVYKGQLLVGTGEDEALAWHFLCWTKQVLDAWNQESGVDLQVDTEDTVLKLPLVDPTHSPEGG